jgi:hypothetical protein
VMDRIESAIAEPQNPFDAELALATKDALEEQRQGLTPENVELVMEDVQQRLRVLESRPFFRKLDALKDKVWHGLSVFSQEGIVIGLEELFAYQEAVAAFDADSCRAQGLDCPAVEPFLDALTHMSGLMEAAAVQAGKGHLMEALEKGEI